MESWPEAFRLLGHSTATRRELCAVGATPRSLTAAVRYRHLVRLHRDCYVLPGSPDLLCAAARHSGAVSCVSALSLWGVFAFDSARNHLAVARSRSRFHAEPSREENGSVTLHWWPHRADEVVDNVVSPLDALAHATRCQRPEHAIASIDSALHLGVVSWQDVAEIFSRVPDRYQPLRRRLDSRAESGQESVLRLLAEDAGFKVQSQMEFPGIGRVDLLLDGCVVLEADSRAHHDGWEEHVRDRGRDLALAALGYPSLRPAYQHTMHRPDQVRAALRGLMATRRR